MADNDLEEGSFLERLKESPRTVSALIIILIVAAAIYAFSGQEEGEQATKVGDETAAVMEEEAVTEGEIADQPEGQVAAEVSEEEQALEQQAEALPQAERTEQGFVEVAQAGDGFTHLARRATTRWLSENQAGYAVSDEHRIYIEDYIQNRLGTRGLTLGESSEITFDLIKEAVAAAGQLNESQLRNLSQYTSALQ